jgi:hypothetical protein
VVYLLNRYPSLVADSQRKPLVAAGELVRGAYITRRSSMAVGYDLSPFFSHQWPARLRSLRPCLVLQLCFFDV